MCIEVRKCPLESAYLASNLALLRLLQPGVLKAHSTPKGNCSRNPRAITISGHNYIGP